MLCVVFDLDDTLYLERDYVRSGFYAVGAWATRHLGLHDFADLAWREFECGRRRDVFNRVLASYGLAGDDIVRQLVHVYRSHLPSISLLSDSTECLQALRPHACLAVISDGPLDSQQKKVQALEFETKMDLVVLTDTWGQEFWKPHPRAFQHIQQQFAVAPNCCVYLGDNPAKDFITPRRLGWRTVRVRRPGGLYFHCEPGDGCAADQELNDLREAASMLLSYS